MNPSDSVLIEKAIILVLAMLTVALFLAFFRLVRGPSLPDRVVALDLISLLAVGIIAVYTITVNQTIFLDAVTVFALFIFLGTVAFARYLEKRGRQ
jgi:multicomponent Na+:H+ antiporter subunit F